MSFFQGTLQEGIATAVQQSKSVVCFVTNNEAESAKWQDEYLTDDTVAPILKSGAVVLRLESGSQEEGFLAQLYPIPKKPTVVVIKNAELREYIASGVSKEDFLRRLRQALQPPPVPAPAPSPNQADQVIAPAPASPPATAAPAAPAADAESASSTSSGRATPTSAAANEAQIQSLLAERAARLAAQKKKDEEEAKRRRLEKSKAKAESIAAGKAPDAQTKHAEALKKKQRVAREERERVLKAIEDDKAARKARQAEKEALRRAAEAAHEAEAKGVPFAPASQLYPSTGRIHEKCALQVRLLDGSTIRSRFSSSDTLKDVRQWVDDTAQLGKTPYTFKILMTPLPSVKLDVTEEGKPLQELGLTPSATLILLPVRRRFAKAYDDAPPPGNIFMRFLAYAVAYISGFFGVILSFIGTLFSTAGPPAPLVDNPSSQGPASGRDGGQNSGARQRRNEQQFYNGNSTNFQPRVDDEDEDEYDN